MADRSDEDEDVEPDEQEPKEDGRRGRGRRARSKNTLPEKEVAKDTPVRERRAEETSQKNKRSLRANLAIAPQEQGRTSRIPSARAPKVKHYGHA